MYICGFYPIVILPSIFGNVWRCLGCHNWGRGCKGHLVDGDQRYYFSSYNTQDSPSQQRRIIRSKILVVPWLRNSTFCPLVLSNWWQLNLHPLTPAHSMTSALVKVKPMVLNPVVSSLSASYSKSQQHLTKVIMAFFLKPFLSHLPEHTNSLVFAIFLFLVSFECSWPLNIRRLRTLSLHFSFFLILIFKIFY